MSAVEKLQGPTLYELGQDWRDMLELLEATDGALTPELEAQLLQLEAETTDRVDRVGWVRARLLSEAAMFDERAKALRGKAVTRKNAVDRLEQRLVDLLESRGLKKIQGDEFQVTLRHADAVVIQCAVQDLPGQYVTYPEPVANKVELKRALKSGEEIDGVVLEPRPFVVVK